MARVLYSAEINELKGSVGGTVFQRNKAGTISKLKPSIVYNPSARQIISRASFNSLVSSWQQLSNANKLLWNTFASTYTKYDYFNVEKNLSGFNWFISINANRLLLVQSQHSTPPAYVTPITAPAFTTFPFDSTLSFLFDVFPERGEYYLFVFATPPLRSVNLQSRKSLRLISIIDRYNTLYNDVTTDWEDYFNISYPSASNSEDYNVLIAVSVIHKDSGIGGQFYLSNEPLNLTFDPTSLGDSMSDLGQQFSQSDIKSIINIGSGIYLAGTGGSGKVLRSTDYGANWSDQGQLGSEGFANCFADCGGGIEICGTIGSAKIFKSTDYGVNWTDKGQLGSESQVSSIAYCGNGILVAGTYSNGKIFRSTDYGENWSDLGTMFSQSQIRALVYIGNRVVLAGTYGSGKVLRSTDYGATWSDLGQQYSQTHINCFAYLGNGIVVAGTGSGGKIIRSTDYGLNWSDLGQQASEAYIQSMAYVSNGVVFAGTQNGGKLLRSDDLGATWSNLGQQGSTTQLNSLSRIYKVGLLAGGYNNAHIYRELLY